MSNIVIISGQKQEVYPPGFDQFLNWLKNKWIPFEVNFAKSTCYIHVIVPAGDWKPNHLDEFLFDRVNVRFSSHPEKEKQLSPNDISVCPHGDKEPVARALVLQKYLPMIMDAGLKKLQEFLSYAHKTLTAADEPQSGDKFLEYWYYPLLK